MRYFFIGWIACISVLMHGQAWQQQVGYRMDVDLNVTTHAYTGTQELTYINHSPDTLDVVFYHLYFNAFQPGSDMDVHVRDLPDPDPRLLRIKTLRPDQQGHLHVRELRQDGQVLQMEEQGTILKAGLASHLLPGDTTHLTMSFEGQVPIMIRRAGRDNEEGIAYSMGQWYPKICAYDSDGWHPNPYIGREFYGDFGVFEVTIRIDRRYTVAASGVLLNADEMGHGYGTGGDITQSQSEDQLAWYFRAEHVHDFVWAADKEYMHETLMRDDGVLLRFFYQDESRYNKNWRALPGIMDAALTLINARFGEYPYPTYAFIQGGDGGMEYPMATLFTGHRSLRSLVSVAVHEIIHSWYQMALATNESLHSWMDEGFTDYAEEIILDELEQQGHIPSTGHTGGQSDEYQRYYQLAGTGWEEPLSTHADHFGTATAYYIAAYSKGKIFLKQLEYIIGKQAMQRTMLRYYQTWKFKHPRPQDFLRIAEMESGMVLDWYYEYWILTTKTIDYAISGVSNERAKTVITLKRSGDVPMPMEICVTSRRGDNYCYYIPLDLMRGEKPITEPVKWTLLPDWPWTSREYTFSVPLKMGQIARIEMDPSGSLADIDQSDNVYPATTAPEK